MMIQSTPLQNIGKPTVLRTKATVTATTSGGNSITKTYDLGSNGGIIKATATNGLGASLTQEATISSSGNTASGSSESNSGICTDCKKTCFHSCAKVCYGTTVQSATGPATCDTNCIGACKSQCSSCTAQCKNGCGLSCSTNCITSCRGSCEGNCWVNCDGCTGCSGCSGSCSDSCKGTCKGKAGGGCFVAGTRILTGNCTWKNIEDIVVGDKVIAYDIKSNRYISSTISKAYTHLNTEQVIEVVLSNGKKLQLTPSHPLLTTEGWKAGDIDMALKEHNVVASLLKIGDTVIGYDDNAIITQIKEMSIPSNFTTYNAEVAVYHTFVAEGIVTHNVKAPLTE